MLNTNKNYSLNEIIGERIKEERELNSMTQEELAKALAKNDKAKDNKGKLEQIDRTAISKYESGKAAIPLDRLKKMAEIFKVSTDYLLGLTENKTPKFEVQAICKYTRLNEKSVEVLHTIVDSKILDTINYLLKQEEISCMPRRIYSKLS